MERRTKILMWLSGIAASNAIRYTLWPVIIWIVMYWGWHIVSEPFREPIKWIFKLFGT